MAMRMQRLLCATRGLAGWAGAPKGAVAKPLPRFDLERMPEWATCTHQLSATDSEPLSLKELLRIAEDAGDVASLQAWDALSLGYPTEHPHGARLLESFSQAHAAEGGHPVLPGGAFTACIPAEGIYLTMRALLKPGDHVVTMHPIYQSLRTVAESIGCHVETWDVDPSTMTFDVGDLEAKLTPATRLVVTNLPHNPTGATLSARELQRVVELVSANGAYLFADEMYRGTEHASLSECTWPGTAALPPICDLYERGISLSGLSKSWGLAGLRLGWVATQDIALLERINELKDYTSICPSAPSEVLGCMALGTPGARDAIITRQRGVMARGLGALSAFLEEHGSAVRRVGPCWVPRGGTMCLVELAADPGEAPTPTATAYAARLAQERSVMLVPSWAFGLDDSMLRVAFARSDVPQGLCAWGKALRQ